MPHQQTSISISFSTKSIKFHGKYNLPSAINLWIIFIISFNSATGNCGSSACVMRKSIRNGQGNFRLVRRANNNILNQIAQFQNLRHVILYHIQFQMFDDYGFWSWSVWKKKCMYVCNQAFQKPNSHSRSRTPLK